MSNCNYHAINDGFLAIENKLDALDTTISGLELQAKIDLLDIDLDNLEAQMKIANKLKLLEAIGIDVMTEQEQLAAYTAIKNELFPANNGIF